MKNDLNTFEIFNHLSKEEVKLFTGNLKIKTFNKNQIIINEGEEGDSLLFVIEGKIVITQALTLATNKLDEGDDREKQLTNLNSKDHKIMLGELALFSPDKKRNASVKALENCQVAEITFEKIFEICNNASFPGNNSMKAPKFIILTTLAS